MPSPNSNVPPAPLSQLEPVDLVQALNSLRHQLDSFQRQVQHQVQVHPMEDSGADFEGGDATLDWDGVTAFLMQQQIDLAQVHTQVELLEQARSHQQSRQKQHQGETFSDLEAIATSQIQQVRLLQSQIARDRLERRSQRRIVDNQVAALQATLAEKDAQILALEAQAFEARTLAVSLNAQRQAAQETIEQLQDALNRRRTELAEITAERETWQTSLEEQQTLATAQTKTLTALQRELAIAQTTIEALESQILHKNRQSLGLQQLRYESELQRGQEQQRYQQIDVQLREYQTQILQQIEQLRSLETQVQDWRTRSLMSEHQLQNIRDWVDQMAKHQPQALPAALRELLDPLDPLPVSHRPRLDPSNSPEQNQSQSQSQSQPPSQLSPHHSPTPHKPLHLDLPKFSP